MNVKPQCVTRNPAEFETIRKKLRKVVARGYLEAGEVESLMNFFGVPKGTDTRMVYDATACGLNSCLFAPWFLRGLQKGGPRTAAVPRSEATRFLRATVEAVLNTSTNLGTEETGCVFALIRVAGTPKGRT
jgi:hypothetical protein